MAQRKVITLSLFNRPGYTSQVLQYLRKCKGIAEYVIIPVIDNDRNSDNQFDMTGILWQFVNTGLRIDKPRYHESSVGCNANIYTCLNIGFMVTDFLIHLEDDILLAPDALEYFEWASAKYKDDQDVFTVDAYNNNRDNTLYPYKVHRAKSFKPWGWATWIDRWEGIKKEWQFGFEARFKDGERVFEGGGWDVCMKKLLRGDRSRIYPEMARCINIGAKNGAHTPSEEFHWNKHKVDMWAGNTEIPAGEFSE